MRKRGKHFIGISTFRQPLIFGYYFVGSWVSRPGCALLGRPIDRLFRFLVSRQAMGVER